MNRPDEFIGQLQAFLDEYEGQTPLPDAIRDAIRADLPMTKQIGPLSGLMRNLDMSINMPAPARYGLAAAVIVAAVIIGGALFYRPDTGGPPEATPTPAATATPAPTSTPAPSEGTGNIFPPAGSLEVGTRYAVTLFESPNETAVVFTFAVPTGGWRSTGEGMFEGHGLSPQGIQLFFSNLDGYIPAVFPDPCVHQGLQAHEASVAGWAEAVTSIPGTEVLSGPAEVVVDGRARQSAVIAIPEDIGCARDQFWLGFNAACALTEPCYSYPTRLGETIHEWVVDVDGILFEVGAQVLYPDQNPDAAAELQQIVDSIQFE